MPLYFDSKCHCKNKNKKLSNVLTSLRNWLKTKGVD